ncbi:hypothetical protein N6H05_01665 [Sphingobium sp. WTD-1]|uniref:hypothetical protein n=1 Tax=Sphingobium sp. WTD-1 TaxID=2979467 RepID=UPI0024DE41D4|nr:hypothetical protein [Sphingobium sp. WTD-1]WIA56561.1 hypothetical protein N6H05_01665 [Sphingobium sp. WTD-1]
MENDESGSARFEMRAPKSWLARVDDWRRQQPELPPRAEAIRRLVDKGLGHDQSEKEG